MVLHKSLEILVHNVTDVRRVGLFFWSVQSVCKIMFPLHVMCLSFKEVMCGQVMQRYCVRYSVTVYFPPLPLLFLRYVMWQTPGEPLVMWLMTARTTDMYLRSEAVTVNALM